MGRAAPGMAKTPRAADLTLFPRAAPIRVSVRGEREGKYPQALPSVTSELQQERALSFCLSTAGQRPCAWTMLGGQNHP